MFVAVVNVRVMFVRMRDRGVSVAVLVGAVPVAGGVMRVLVMRVVNVAVRMLEDFVGVRMSMLFGQVQPDAEPHERRCQP